MEENKAWHVTTTRETSRSVRVTVRRPASFSGRTPRQAALKAARRLDPAPSEDVADETELKLREKGTKKIHVYEGWAWEETSPDDSPDWMPEEITEANVSKQGIKKLEEL